MRFLKIPSTKDTIGCAPSEHQPEVPDVSEHQLALFLNSSTLDKASRLMLSDFIVLGCHYDLEYYIKKVKNEK